MEKQKQKRRRGGFGVVCLLCAAALASLLPQPSGAADPTTWHPDPARHVGKPSTPGAIDHGTPARHHHDTSLPPLSAPPPTAGADLPAPLPRPHFSFPLQPTFGNAAPPVGQNGGEGYPFIGSNPTVPLPTGMTDTATVLPMPDGTAGDATGSKVVGLAPPVGVQVSMIALVLAFSIPFLATG